MYNLINSQQLCIVLGGSVTYAEVPVAVSYTDSDGKKAPTILKLTDSLDPVVICPAPQKDNLRSISNISVVNTDTAAISVTIYILENGEDTPISKTDLAIGDQLYYNSGDGWSVLDVDGKKKAGSATGGSGLTDAELRARPVDVLESTATTIYNGKKTIATAGTQEAIAASQAVKSVTVKALSTNTGLVYVGKSTVASTDGYQLSARESVSLDVSNLSSVYVDVDTNGEGVTYIAIN